MKQWCLNADHFLLSPAASEPRICNLSSVTLVSFCHELEHREHISCMIYLQAHFNRLLTLPYSVDERLLLMDMMYLCIAHTIKAFDVQISLVRIIFGVDIYKIINLSAKDLKTCKDDIDLHRGSRTVLLTRTTL